MEALLVLLIVVGAVIWLCAGNPGSREGPVSAPPDGHAVPPPAARPLPAAFPATPSIHDDAAFFDGYVWGRLQERHDERQHDHGSADEGGHDHDMFDGDDGYDDS